MFGILPHSAANLGYRYANSKSVAISGINDNEFCAPLREPARGGRATLALVDLLARYYGF